MSYRVNRKKNLRDDAESNTALVFAGSKYFTLLKSFCKCLMCYTHTSDYGRNLAVTACQETAF